MDNAEYINYLEVIKWIDQYKLYKIMLQKVCYVTIHLI